jgi:peptidoglycan-associated lipoprotein
MVRQEMRAGDQAVQSDLGGRIDASESRTNARIAALEQGLRALGEEFEGTVERIESSLRFNAPVHFAFDEATIREVDQPVLDRFAQVVGDYYDGSLITVEGFADPSGSDAYNQRLGQERAEAVKQYLEGAGIPADRVRAVSYGEAVNRQVVAGASGPGDRGWENRRVAMVVDFSSPMTASSPQPTAEGSDP